MNLTDPHTFTGRPEISGTLLAYARDALVIPATSASGVNIKTSTLRKTRFYSLKTSTLVCCAAVLLALDFCLPGVDACRYPPCYDGICRHGPCIGGTLHPTRRHAALARRRLASRRRRLPILQLATADDGWDPKTVTHHVFLDCVLDDRYRGFFDVSVLGPQGFVGDANGRIKDSELGVDSKFTLNWDYPESFSCTFLYDSQRTKGTGNGTRMMISLYLLMQLLPSPGYSNDVMRLKSAEKAMPFYKNMGFDVKQIGSMQPIGTLKENKLQEQLSGIHVTRACNGPVTYSELLENIEGIVQESDFRHAAAESDSKRRQRLPPHAIANSLLWSSKDHNRPYPIRRTELSYITYKVTINKWSTREDRDQSFYLYLPITSGDVEARSAKTSAEGHTIFRGLGNIIQSAEQEPAKDTSQATPLLLKRGCLVAAESGETYHTGRCKCNIM